MKNLLLFLSFTLLLSCSVQKRKYQKGFYIAKLHHKNQTGKKERIVQSTTSGESNSMPETVISVKSGQPPVLDASAGNGEGTYPAKKHSFISAAEDSCDVLFFKDGSEVRAKVTEVNVTDVKYKRCDNQDGPSYVTKKSDLFMIKYANGTREVIKTEPEVKNTAPSASTFQYKSNKPVKVLHPMAGLSLALGILAVVLSFVPFFLFIVPPAYLGLMFLSALVATIVGGTTLRQIKRQQEIYRGKGFALPGFLMALITLCIYVFLLLIFLLIFI